MAFDPGQDRASVEAFYTARRLTELRLRPVTGDFDTDHLREINRRIFQDMPGLGFNDVTPGSFRPPSPRGQDWIKDRRLDTVSLSTQVAYSSMDADAVYTLDTIMSGVQSNRFRVMDTVEFTRVIANLYARLDFIHPFADGNSRTLREFTRQLADAAGYDLRWETFGQSPAGRDILYVARDISVNRQALDRVRHNDTRRDLLFTLDQLEGNRDLPELLLSAGKAFIQPKRAVAFERLDPSEATHKFPELEPVYRQLDAATAHARDALPQNAEIQSRFLTGVRARIQTTLDAGGLVVEPRERDAGRSPVRNDPER